jgi:hypothetical protein
VAALTAQDALRRAVSSPANMLTHFAVGYPVAKSRHLRVAIVLLPRQLCRPHPSPPRCTHTSLRPTVYADELERSEAGALVVTMEAAPELELL